jgi:phosphatidylglycerol---prolipoprotein diacylglyceryl transferase
MGCCSTSSLLLAIPKVLLCRMTTSVWTHPQFDPVALALGPIAIHWYGLMYLLAFVGVLALGRIRLGSQAAGRPQFTPRDLDDVLLYGVLGVVLGGRLGYVIFYKPAYYLAHPAEILAIWQGGMAFHGGLLGVIAALAIFAWRRRMPFFTVADFIAPLVPFGLAAGRIGNFINGELWGRVADPTAIPWAMVFPQAGDGLARHPSQLYQMGLEGIGLFIILWWYSSRPRPLGAVSGMFLIGYGGFRFLAEFAREPDQFLGVLSLGLSMGQWLSIPMILLGLVIIRIAHRRVRVD